MSATQPAFARSGEEMTPPATLADRAKRTVLRKVVDRLRPLAYRRGAGGIRCLTFHYLFEHERERADRLFRALKRCRSYCAACRRHRRSGAPATRASPR